MCIRRSSGVSPSWWSQSSARPSQWITVLTLSWRPSVPSSERVLQLGMCREEVYARLRPPRHSRCLAKGALQSLPPSHWHHCMSPSGPPHLLPFLIWRLAVRGRSMVVASRLPSPNRSRLFWPSHCVDVSLLPPCSLPSGIIATPEAGTSCTTLRVRQLVHQCSLLATFTFAYFLCSSVVKVSALCGESLIHHVSECATRCKSLVV